MFHNVSSVYNSGSGVDADAGLANSVGLQANSADGSTSTASIAAGVVSPPSGVSPSSSGYLSAGSRTASYGESEGAQHSGSVHGDGGKQAKLWAAYMAVNKQVIKRSERALMKTRIRATTKTNIILNFLARSAQFADVIVQHFNEGDLVWIHGFHLLLLPSFLTRRVGPMAKIGLFLHTPFPSSEIFRTLWCREDLLRGMLNADQVGFHLYEYARHFLTCCR